MLLNRYSYVAGNPTNFVDPSGMIAEKPGKWDRCAYEEACCGYDVTEWFLAELHIHGSWAYSHLLTWIGDLGQIWWPGFGNYARSIPYKWMTFDTGLSHCPSPGCERGVTLCGKCIDRSELGNIMYGATGAAISIDKWTLRLAGKLAGALRGEAEMAGLDIGFEIGTNKNYRTIWDVDDLCSFITTHTPSAWGKINVGQDPDVSLCAPCSDILPPDGSIIPHTRPHTDLDIGNYEGTSPCADGSKCQGDPTDPFFINQIPGAEWLAPELCPDATMYSEEDRTYCGTGVRRP
jgi:hypothetical protein